MIPELKKDIDKAIYLDVDLVVDFDKKELYNIDMEGKPLAAIQEKCMKYMKQFMIHCLYLGLNHKTYFNSRVLILDLRYFRENNITEILFNKLKENIDNIICVDQDIFNIIFINNYKQLEYKYNVLTRLKQLLKDNHDEDLKDFDNIKIYHFAEEQKPWNSTIPYEEKWFEYAQKVFEQKVIDNFCSIPKNKMKNKKLFGLLKEKNNNATTSFCIFGHKIRIYKKTNNEYTTKNCLVFVTIKRKNQILLNS